MSKKGKEIGENMVLLQPDGPDMPKKTKKKRGRKMKIKSAKDLERLIDKYFSAISYTTYVKDPATGALLTDIDGDLIERTVYITPPDVLSLCLFLGITYTTWENYSDAEKNPDYAPICERAKMKMESHLRELLTTREKGSVQGIIFNLQHNYGWKDKKTVELGEETVDALGNLSLSEKMAMVASLKSGELDIPEPIEDDEDDEDDD